MKFGVEFEANYPVFADRRRKGFIYFDGCGNEYGYDKDEDEIEINVEETLKEQIKPIFSGWNPNVHFDGEEDDNCVALEFCTPPLMIGGKNTKKSFSQLREVYKVFKKMKTKGYWGCGIHIHISLDDGWRKIRDQKAENFLNFLVPRQDIFYAIGDREREYDGMCEPIDYSSYGAYRNKYNGANFHDLYPTIEFRYFPSLPDMDTLKTWIMLCAETVKIGYGREHKRDYNYDENAELTVEEMIKPYSKPLRKRLLALMDRGKNPDKFYYSEVK